MLLLCSVDLVCWTQTWHVLFVPRHCGLSETFYAPKPVGISLVCGHSRCTESVNQTWISRYDLATLYWTTYFRLFFLLFRKYDHFIFLSTNGWPKNIHDSLWLRWQQLTTTKNGARYSLLEYTVKCLLSIQLTLTKLTKKCVENYSNRSIYFFN